MLSDGKKRPAYPLGLRNVGDETASSSSPRSRRELRMMPQNAGHLQELLCLGMAVGRTILGNVLLVCLHSLKSRKSGVKAMRM